MPDEDPKPAQGVALRAARKGMRMSQAHLAQAAGVSDRTVRRAESGRVVTDEVLRALCSVLGLNAAQFGIPAAAVGPAQDLRAMSEFEFSIRAFAFAITKWMGGVHPLFATVIIMLEFELRPGTLACAVLAPVVMWAFSRKCGATRREAFAFLQGRAFVDGTPVLIEERIEVLREARRAQSASPVGG